MEKFGVFNEKNSYGVNKLINAILSSNGHYEEYMSGEDLQNSKFSILVAPKSYFGLAYLKLKFRERDLDIDGLKISQDLSELQKNGVSKVIINFNVKKYEKKDSSNLFHHPRAEELNNLEKQKQIAKQNKDQVAYNNAQSSIEKIIRETRVEVSQEQWDKMSLPQKISFVQVKINEAKILHDEYDELKYWNANLEHLKSKLDEESKNQENNVLSNNNSESQLENQKSIQQSDEKKDYRFYYNEMMNVVKKYNPNQDMSEDQRKKLMGEIFYHEGYMIHSLSNDEEIGHLMTLVVNELTKNDMQKRLLDTILNDIQEKYNQLHPELQEQKKKPLEKAQNNTKNDSNDLDLSGLINQLRKRLQQVFYEYDLMLTDGYIDYENLAILIHKVDNVIDDGYFLKTLATKQKDIVAISTIIDTLETGQKKMKRTLYDVEETGRRNR